MSSILPLTMGISISSICNHSNRYSCCLLILEAHSSNPTTAHGLKRSVPLVYTALLQYIHVLSTLHVFKRLCRSAFLWSNSVSYMACIIDMCIYIGVYTHVAIYSCVDTVFSKPWGCICSNTYLLLSLLFSKP